MTRWAAYHAALLLAAPAVAAEDGVPFMRCSFDDGRDVILSRMPDHVAWQEGVFSSPIVTETPRSGDDPILTYLLPVADPERIDVFLGWYADSIAPDRVGRAMLSRTIFDDAGDLQSVTVPGQCVDMPQ